MFFKLYFLFLTWVRYNFSPTNYTNFTPLFSLKRLFLPQIAQITRIHFFSFFRFALWLRQMRSTDLHRFLPCGSCFFFRHEDKRTYSFSRRLFSPTECMGFLYRTDVILFLTECPGYMEFFMLSGGCGLCADKVMVYLWYIYGIFMVYLWYIYSIFMVCCR